MNNYVVTNMSGESQTYQSQASTVRALLTEQNIPSAGVSIFVNGEIASLEEALSDGDIIVMVAKTTNS